MRGGRFAWGYLIFVYPGDPVSAYYSGNRSLLRDGARYFTTAQDILQDMNWLDNLSYVGQNIVCPAQARLETAAESAVYHALEKGILSFEQILSVTDLTSSELMSTLTVMQIRKLIDPLPGKRYQIRTDSNC